MKMIKIKKKIMIKDGQKILEVNDALFRVLISAFVFFQAFHGIMGSLFCRELFCGG